MRIARFRQTDESPNFAIFDMVDEADPMVTALAPGGEGSAIFHESGLYLVTATIIAVTGGTMTGPAQGDLHCAVETYLQIGLPIGGGTG